MYCCSNIYPSIRSALQLRFSHPPSEFNLSEQQGVSVKMPQKQIKISLQITEYRGAAIYMHFKYI